MLSKKSTVDLKTRNKDYAVFLPSISGFYQTFISKQQKEEFVPTNRIPKEFENGIEGMNFLNKEQAYFYYPDALYSAGHAQLDVTKSYVEESMVQQRDKTNPDSFILGDSGGFQIGKGVINFDWQHFWEKQGDAGYVGTADKTRMAILNWLEFTADYSMVLDIPTWAYDKNNGPRTGLKSFKDCLDGTLFNNNFFLKHRQGKTKFLNVLQGANNEDAEVWYQAVKNLPFEGWAMGGNNMKDADLMLRRLIIMRDEKLLEPGRDVIHFLGTSKLELACLLTAIQRNIKKYVNPNMKITFDCASPFLATAYGQAYTQHVHTNKRFSYIMDKAIDDRRLAGSTTPWPWNSPVGERMGMGDACYYKPGDLNKLGKEGKTSWDSFSYFLMMGHNVYQHIESVQRANALNDTACGLHQPDPSLWQPSKKGFSGELSNWVPRNVIYMTELVNRVFKSETPMTELDKVKIAERTKISISVLDMAQPFLADFNSKKTLKTNAKADGMLFEINKGNDNDAGNVDDWDIEEAENILKEAA
jgi:hypothetical protein